MHVGDIVGTQIFDRVLKPNLDRCFAGEEISFAEWFDNHDGRKYWAVTYSPLRLDSERVDSALAVARDVTDLTLAAENLREAQTQLAHVNRIATIGQLAASIAHEVNQPIGALVTNADAAMRMLSAERPNLSEAREALGDIIKDGRRASDVIQHIRGLVKKAPAQTDLFDINEVIIETIALARSEILRNGVSLETPLGRDLPPIRADRVQVQQVIMNLVMNAVEAMSILDEGRRELRIATLARASKVYWPGLAGVSQSNFHRRQACRRTGSRNSAPAHVCPPSVLTSISITSVSPAHAAPQTV